MGSCVSSSAKVDSTNTSTVASGFSKDTGCSKSSDQCYSKVEIGSSVKTEGEILSSPNVKSFSLSDLKSITRNFQYQVGEGGFGLVFKGWMDEQTLVPSKPGLGMVVAVKKLRSDSFQGHREWLTEVNYLGHFHHSNLVKLIGYCLDGDNRLLVYEFMAKGSLENHLFKRGSQPLPWETRIKIALGAARGLSFLHNPESQVIYRDVKSSNILLDADFNAKLSDFGLVKAGPSGDQTHVSTQIIGTQGYAAPEYIATGRLSARCDVYSFGVVLLELLTGRPALLKNKFGADDSLVEWAKPYVGDKRKLFRIMDIKLEGQYPKTEACVLASLASQCLNNDSKLRPQMTEVCSILEQIYNKKNTVQSASLHLHSPRSNPKSKSPINLTPVVSPLPSPHHQSSRER